LAVIRPSLDRTRSTINSWTTAVLRTTRDLLIRPGTANSWRA
jgi:hypothetical protein